MSRIIYYFSGTGNSLVVARDIAKKINGQFISIPSVVHQEIIKTEADMIGIVFPMYHHGVPLIIKRFINKMDDLEKNISLEYAPMEIVLEFV